MPAPKSSSAKRSTSVSLRSIPTSPVQSRSGHALAASGPPSYWRFPFPPPSFQSVDRRNESGDRAVSPHFFATFFASLPDPSLRLLLLSGHVRRHARLHLARQVRNDADHAL